MPNLLHWPIGPLVNTCENQCKKHKNGSKRTPFMNTVLSLKTPSVTLWWITSGNVRHVRQFSWFYIQPYNMAHSDLHYIHNFICRCIQYGPRSAMIKILISNKVYIMWDHIREWGPGCRQGWLYVPTAQEWLTSINACITLVTSSNYRFTHKKSLKFKNRYNHRSSQTKDNCKKIL